MNDYQKRIVNFLAQPIEYDQVTEIPSSEAKSRLMELMKEYRSIKQKTISDNDKNYRNSCLPVSNFIDFSMIDLIEFDFKELTSNTTISNITSTSVIPDSRENL